MSVHPSPELRSLFEAALNEFESRAGTNLVQYRIFNELVACESVESVLDILQEQIKPLRTSLGNESTLMKWIKRTVHILHSLSTNHIVVSGVSSTFPPAKAVFVGIAILLSAIKDVDKSYDTLVDLFESFESFLRRLDIYSKIPSTPAMTEVIVRILAELLCTISLAIQQIKQGRLKKIGKKLLGENDHEVEAILRRLDRLTLEEARMTGTTTLEVVYDLLKNMKMVMDDKSMFMDDIRRTLVDMQQIASNMNKLRRDELQEKVRRWLSPPDPSINHNMARKTHRDGSAKWFIEGTTFQGWKTGRGSLLWVSGKPGSGKSILSSSVIEDLKMSRKAGLASIVFFYFDFKDESKKTAHGALSSLLVQLAAQSDPYSEILSALYSEHDAGSMQPSDDALKMTLKMMLAVPSQAPIYIVIDALDECPNSVGTPTPRENVLSLVEWLSELCYLNLWVCVTSRPEADIEVILKPLAPLTVSLHGETGQQEDIKNYIKWFVNSDPKARKWKKQDKELIIEKLSEQANGMFRWVFCQLDRLRQCIVSRIRRALDELPETLDETYERTLLDINKENWAYAHRLFQCLVVALRPLRVEELAEFLAFEFENGRSPIFQADCRPEDPREAVLSTCSSLITVVDDDGSAFVQFSHFSVKEYLTSTRIAEGRVPQYNTHLGSAHFLVTQACLSTLLGLDDEITEERMKDFPLVEYAAWYWVGHAKIGNGLSQTEDIVKQLFDPRNPHFAAWISICDMKPQATHYPPIKNSRPTPLYYAAELNLRGVAEWLVNERSQNINAFGGYHGTPLHAASGSGSLEVMEFLLMCHEDGNRVTDPRVLLDQCTKIDAINDRAETPLTVAIIYGPMETLMEATNLLLCHGANPNLTGRDSPLHAAVGCGRYDVMHLLQRHGADPKTWDCHGGTLLHAALNQGGLKVAQVVLEFGVDINYRDHSGRTPLHVTPRKSEDIALRLLERGADPGVRDDTGQTPLHVASFRGMLKFARRLLEIGVDVNSRDIYGLTPLHLIRSESEDVALLLLERGADPGVRDDAGQTPLHAASRSRGLKFARLLLEHSFDVNSRDNQDRTPLHVALGSDNDVALLLLERGADPGIRDNAGRTPLHVASQEGNLKFALRLLDLGVDVNPRDNQGMSPLHAGPSDVALLLLERGADPGVRDDYGRTLLHVAFGGRNLEFARRLLELGVDINSRDNRGRTPLHRVDRWDGEVTLLLLERGADPGVRDDAGKTPLHSASQSRNLKLIRRLLELGVDVNSRDNQGWTPLHEIPEAGDDVALLLLENGADPGVRDDAGQTPLHSASRSGCPNFAQRLLEHGFDVNSRDNQGRTPLHVAQGSDNDVALLLLEHGADPGIRDNAGQTPLHVASQMGNLGFVWRLLELGADINSRDNQGRTPLHVMSHFIGHVALQLLDRGADPDVRDDAGQTLLHSASHRNDFGFALRLLEHGVGVNSLDNQGRTPLHVVKQMGDEFALLLLKHGADPGVQDDAGQTPLHVASREGMRKFARRLLELGVDVNSRDNQGRMPLHVVKQMGDEVALLLLEHGADPGVQDDAGQTPLHVASREGMLKFARRLLELGVDVNSRDNQGRTPLHVIQQGGDKVALLLLESGGADPGVRDNAGQTLLHAASRSGTLRFARRLLELGVGVDSHDNQGRTPLHGVARWGKVKVTQRLLDLGRNLDWEDYGGWIDLDRVWQWGKQVSLLLLERGADPDVRDNDGQTPLHVASREGNLTVVQQLLTFGVDVNSHDGQGRTAFQIAVEGGHDEVEELLLDHGADSERP